MKAGVIACVLLVALPAGADVCQQSMAGPVRVSVRDNGIDESPDACLGSKFRTSVRGIALIDTPDFYGTLAGSLFVGYDYLHFSGIQLELGARMVDFRFAQNAVATADEFSYGPVIVGVAHGIESKIAGREGRWSPSLRLALPRTDSGYEITTVAATPSLAVAVRLRPTVTVHGRFSALLWAALPNRNVERRLALVATSDFSYAPVRWFAIVGGVEMQGGWHGVGLDHLMPRFAVRFAPGRDNRLELAAAAPAILGNERADAVVQLSFSVATAPAP